MTFNPDKWLTSLASSIKEYAIDQLDGDLYDLIFFYPEAADLSERVPFAKTVISFEIDDSDSAVLGFGDCVVGRDQGRLGIASLRLCTTRTLARLKNTRLDAMM